MSLTRTCRISRKEFIITDEDLGFYDKISPVIAGKKYSIPPPTLCPEERLRRRLSWRNMHSLYKTQCSLTGGEIISLYNPKRGYKGTDQSVWWSDKVDNVGNGRNYNPSQSFTEQFDKVLRETPIPCLSNEYKSNINSDYVQGTNYIKDCYLVYNAGNSENCEYCDTLFDSNSIFDSYFVRECDNCYDCISISRCYNCISLEESEDCTNVDYSYNMKGCSDCLLCYGLENKKYYINNIELSKEEYHQEKQKYFRQSGGYDIQTLSELFFQIKNSNPIKKEIIYTSEDVSGNHLRNCYHVHHSHDVIEGKNCKYVGSYGYIQDCYDCFSWGYTAENCYECCAVGSRASGLMGCYAVWGGTSRMYYCYTCFACTDCFGCVGLKNKQYCILNKQYTKEEYQELVGKIIENMIRDGEWGEYLAPENSPWGYNETMANLYFPLEKQEAIELGYQWNDYEAPRPEATKYIPASLVPENIADIPDDILNWAIECEVSGKYYKINKPELEFYRKHHLPLPKKHYDVRRRERFDRRFR